MTPLNLNFIKSKTLKNKFKSGFSSTMKQEAAPDERQGIDLILKVLLINMNIKHISVRSTIKQILIGFD